MSKNITPHIHSVQTNAFAMQYGLGLGVYQVLIGIFFISGLSSSLSSLLMLAMLLATPILSVQLMLRFRNSVCEGKLSFGRGFKFGVLMYIYAGIILALVTYIYFAYFDHGALANYYATALTQPENTTLLTAIQPELTVEHFVQLIRDIQPVTYATNVLINNTFVGAIIAAITAAFIRK